MNRNQTPTQQSYMQQIFKWLRRFMLLVLLLSSTICVLNIFSPNILVKYRYFFRHSVCNNTLPPEYQTLPDNLISLDELVAQRESLESTVLTGRSSHFESSISKYVTHPDKNFYFVFEYEWYSHHVYACSENQGFKIRYFWIPMAENIIWAQQDGKLYVVKIKEYSYEGVAEVSFCVYDGDTLELITRDYNADSDLD